MIERQITQDDVGLAERVGKRRREIGLKKWGWHKQNTSKYLAAIEEITGVLGEIIVKRYYGIPIKFVDGSDGGDFMINGKSVDIKASQPKEYTSIERLNLLVHPEAKPYDYYIQVFISNENTKAQIVGWTTRKALVEHNEWMDYEGHKLHKFPVKRLFPIETLKILTECEDPRHFGERTENSGDWWMSFPDFLLRCEVCERRKAK